MDQDRESLRQALVLAARRMREAREERDALIATATAAGMSRREVGEAVGLSRAGVQHILGKSRP